jgi:hypothetical protein
LLQKSQIARRQFSGCKKIRPTTADRCVPNHVTEVASEFIFNGEAAHKLLLEADRRGVKPDLLASQLLEFIAIDDMFRAVLDG